MVHFVGAGPGAPDLITQRGAALLRAAPNRVGMLFLLGTRLLRGLLRLLLRPAIDHKF